MKGTVGFSASNSWISKIIRWFRQSNVSHTFIIINRGDRLFVMEAGKRQVQIASYDKHYAKNKGYVELYKPEVDDTTINKAIDDMMPYLERGYGYLQLVGFALVSLLQRIGINIDNPIGTGIICSELVREYLLKLGFEEYRKLDRDTTAPDNLLALIKKSKKFKRMVRPDE